MTYDALRASVQALTFAYADGVFAACGLTGDYSAGFHTPDGGYTNTAFLLSDQCGHSLKCSVYEGVGTMNRIATEEYTGSILKQLDDAYAFLRPYYSSAEVVGYPAAAVWEALVNAVAHRDYAYTGSTLVNVFDDRIVFVSIGGLTDGLTTEDIAKGISQPRNAVLMGVLCHLNRVAGCGTGLARIRESYTGCAEQPTIEATAASFVVTLPNRRARKATDTAREEELVLTLFRTRYMITEKDAARLLSGSAVPAATVLNSLLEQKKVVRVGSVRAAKYVLAE